MIPTRLSAFCSVAPLFRQVTDWTLLRSWSLSEVYRATLPSGETRIIKWGNAEMAGEAAIYRQLIHPLKISAPYIYSDFNMDTSAVIIMEDAGEHNLEQLPSAAAFLESARELARLRKAAAANLEKGLPHEVTLAYTVSAAEFIALLDDLLRVQRLSGNRALATLRHTFPDAVNELYLTTPLTLVHHDYHAKNLLVQGQRILPIDWSNAYLSPHLGDLYCLIAEAHTWSGVPKDDILHAFHYEHHAGLTLEQLNWQVNIGGICWLIKTLRWLLYGGTQIIPGSDAWIPDLMYDLEQLIIEVN
ncbi:phosphotransferase [Paenibacillus sp. GCM10027626]|uniref:phosphotransferase n=1 Tax=Paenibacillus sp. GCM10027626 TaxID=3273411 RepID=UPI00363252F7